MVVGFGGQVVSFDKWMWNWMRRQNAGPISAVPDVTSRLPIASLSITVLLYNGPILQAVSFLTSATKYKTELVGKKWHILDGKCCYVQSNGIGHTRYLAEQHSREAVRQIQQLEPSVERDALISATQRVINRLKWYAEMQNTGFEYSVTPASRQRSAILAVMVHVSVAKYCEVVISRSWMRFFAMILLKWFISFFRSLCSKFET